VLAVGVSGAIDTAGKISASSCSAISSWGARDRVCCSQWTVVTGRALVTALRTFRCGVGLNGTAHTVVAWLAAVCVVLCHLKCSHSAVRARFTWWTLQREASADICVVALIGLATTLSKRSWRRNVSKLCAVVASITKTRWCRQTNRGTVGTSRASKTVFSSSSIRHVLSNRTERVVS
jgi:hypothetical protein